MDGLGLEALGFPETPRRLPVGRSCYISQEEPEYLRGVWAKSGYCHSSLSFLQGFPHVSEIRQRLPARVRLGFWVILHHLPLPLVKRPP